MRMFVSMILVVTLLSCGDDMKKPDAITLFDPPAGSNVEFPPTEILEGGYTDGDPDNPLYAKNYNAFEKQNSKWLKYLTTDKVYYISTSTGDDTEGDGTSNLPFATIKKAVEQLIRGQSAEIILMDSDSYDITADIDAFNNRLYIHDGSGVTAQIKHKVYGATNRFYKFNLYDSSEIRISVKKHMLEDVDAGKATENSACAFESFTGINKVDIFTYDSGGGGGLFMPTNLGTSGLPNLVKNATNYRPMTSVTIAGYNVTGERGYIFDTNGVPCMLHSDDALDYPDYWVRNGVTQNQILTTGVASTSLGSSITLYINGSALDAHDTATFNDTDDDATIKAIILPWLEAMFVMLNVNIEFSTARTSAPEKTRSLVIEMKGDFAGKSLPFSIYFSGTDRKGYFYESQKAVKNMNVLTNISAIK